MASKSSNSKYTDTANMDKLKRYKPALPIIIEVNNNSKVVDLNFKPIVCDPVDEFNIKKDKKPKDCSKVNKNSKNELSVTFQLNKFDKHEFENKIESSEYSIEKTSSSIYRKIKAIQQPLEHLPNFNYGYNFNFSQINPFILSILKAFADHKSVEINPSHLQYCIISSYSSFCNKFEARPLDKVLIHMPLNTSMEESDTVEYGKQWEKSIEGIVDDINKHTGTQMNERMSCASQTDYIANSVAVMECMKNTFDYQVITMCGIENIRLLGNKADWQILIDCLPDSKNPIINWWKDCITFIVKKFMDVFDGNADLEFFNSIIKWFSISGSIPLTGWILMFFVPHLCTISDYDKFISKGINDSKKGINMDSLSCLHVANLNDLNTGISVVPINWFNSGQNYDVKLAAGFTTERFDLLSGFYSVKTDYAIYLESVRCAVQSKNS